MSENEAVQTHAAAAGDAEQKAPARRRSTSVKTAKPAKEPADAAKGDSAPSGRPARMPRKSVKASGQGAGQGKRSANAGAQGKQNAGGGTRQKQNGGQGKQGNGRNGNQNIRRQRRQHGNQGPREVQPSVSREDLAKLKVAELREKAAELSVDVTGLKKAELVEAVFEASVRAEGFIEVSGILDILADGYGFLRTQGYLPSETDCYVGLSTIRRNGLRKGDLVCGQTRPARENEKYAAIQKVTSVNGTPIDQLGPRVRFGDLTPVYPDECLIMEHGKQAVTARVIDLVSPIGKGQRGLIVSPPKAGKTTILKDIAASISANNPEVHLMCLLVDERPEEVTDMQRSIKGEVVSSTFDMPTENHIAVSELVIERAKRLVECGKDVVILLDSLTRLARAYNLAQPASGRILSGGVDSTALYPPKKFLGAARNIEGGGSLTILASALVETGSKMDEVIFEEFKGTGNMELKLDRNLADRRIFPAIDPVASGTRKEDLLLDPQEAPLIWAVRRILANTSSTERAMDMLIKSLKQTDTNQEFLLRTAKKAQHSTKADGAIEF
ncbi:transcription termination factor Rho [Gordonibacter sp. An230]|uniref:transcription termination factor Rho n=1 Tax=Gordonibacter sp. An230 TaxID=1965592 RepID=UPI000B37FA0F|nr:transcription termination factor Rho [Gordonibacter sp. An230]OUO87019.1 transcription termination factor Rho [Gordonibacter sp. An230]